MPTLNERISSDYVQAFKAGQKLRVDTLRLIRAGIQKLAIDARKEKLDDAEVMQVLNQQAKQRRETIEAAKKAGREAMAAQSAEELAIIEAYLPPAASDADLQRWVDEAIAGGAQNPGLIIKQVIALAAGSADGKRVSSIVNERLKRGA